MKIAIAVATAVLAGSCATAAVNSTAVKFRTVASGAYAQSSSGAAQLLVARDADVYKRMWDVLIGAGAPPAVDFSTETVLFLLDRQRMHGGYSLEPVTVSIADGAARIEVTMHAPKRGAMTAQVLTTPWAVIAVANRDVREARWVEKATGAVVTETAKEK